MEEAGVLRPPSSRRSMANISAVKKGQVWKGKDVGTELFPLPSLGVEGERCWDGAFSPPIMFPFHGPAHQGRLPKPLSSFPFLVVQP